MLRVVMRGEGGGGGVGGEGGHGCDHQGRRHFGNLYISFVDYQELNYSKATRCR